MTSKVTSVKRATLTGSVVSPTDLEAKEVTLLATDDHIQATNNDGVIIFIIKSVDIAEITYKTGYIVIHSKNELQITFKNTETKIGPLRNLVSEKTEYLQLPIYAATSESTYMFYDKLLKLGYNAKPTSITKLQLNQKYIFITVVLTPLVISSLVIFYRELIS